MDISYAGPYDVLMRTTLTLDADVAAQLKRLMRAQRMTLKAAVNAALRRGLAAAADGAPLAPFEVEAHACGGFLPGIDPGKLGQLADDLEAAAALPPPR